ARRARSKRMYAAAITLMAVGSLGIGGAIVMEIITHEPVYKVLMKFFPWVFGVGAVCLALAITGG
ncbi:unnamed protein product, partial [marine sediment metagenome]